MADSKPLPEIRHPLLAIGERIAAERRVIRMKDPSDEDAAESARQEATAEPLKLNRAGRKRAAPSLDSRMGALASLKQLATSKDVPWETKRKAINDIIEKSGWSAPKSAMDFRSKTHEELVRYIEDVVLVALQEVGIRDARNSDRR